MEWTSAAEAAIKKVPFFVRKRVKSRVEAEARAEGKATITPAEVEATRQRYVSGMAAEVRGYRIETCFGPSGCPNRAVADDGLEKRLDELFRKADLLALLKQRVRGDLKFHHEFGIGLADCPNACSRPQIRDLAVIGAVRPAASDAACTGCADCVAACAESAIRMDPQSGLPQIDSGPCLLCGECIRACPAGHLCAGERGYRILIGGKLGRHPRLGIEIPGIFGADDVLAVAGACIEFYRGRSPNGERFASILTQADIADFIRRFGK